MSQRRDSKRARSGSDEIENDPIMNQTRSLRPLTASESVTVESCDEWKKILEKTAENVTFDTLIKACRANRLDVAEVLLRDYEIDINTRDRAGNILLHVGDIMYNSDCVQFLLEHGINVDAKNHEDITPLMGACCLGQWQCVQLLLAKNANPAMTCKSDNATALIVACANGHTECVSILLEYNTEIIHQCIKDGSTPLFVACQEGHAKCASLILSKDTETINIPRRDGNTPLIIACSFGYIDCARLLLDHSADFSQADQYGSTSLQQAALNGHADCVSLLLEKGADPNQVNNTGLSPLHAACHTARTECIRLLIDHGAVISQFNQEGITPLLVACQTGHTDCVSLLLEKGADPNQVNNTGLSPLHMTCQNGYTDCTRLLLDHGADINISRNDGITPLHAACNDGHINCVRFLLEHDIRTIDVKCVSLAIDCDYWDIVQLLLNHGAPVEKEYALLRPQRLQIREEMCTVCLDPVKELVSFLPCGHSCCCRDCLIPMVHNGIKCPLCRTKVESTLLMPKNE